MKSKTYSIVSAYKLCIDESYCPSRSIHLYLRDAVFDSVRELEIVKRVLSLSHPDISKHLFGFVVSSVVDLSNNNILYSAASDSLDGSMKMLFHIIPSRLIPFLHRNGDSCNKAK